MPIHEAILLILMLAALEGILSADNAMVLAILVRPLPPELRKKALLDGIVAAYVLRGLALAFASEKFARSLLAWASISAASALP